MIYFDAGVKGEEKKKSDYSLHCHLVSWYSGSISRMCLIMKLLINTKQVRQEKQTWHFNIVEWHWNLTTHVKLSQLETVGVGVCVSQK